MLPTNLMHSIVERFRGGTELDEVGPASTTRHIVVPPTVSPHYINYVIREITTAEGIIERIKERIDARFAQDSTFPAEGAGIPTRQLRPHVFTHFDATIYRDLLRTLTEQTEGIEELTQQIKTLIATEKNAKNCFQVNRHRSYAYFNTALEYTLGGTGLILYGIDTFTSNTQNTATQGCPTEISTMSRISFGLLTSSVVLSKLKDFLWRRWGLYEKRLSDLAAIAAENESTCKETKYYIRLLKGMTAQEVPLSPDIAQKLLRKARQVKLERRESATGNGLQDIKRAVSGDLIFPKPGSVSSTSDGSSFSRSPLPADPPAPHSSPSSLLSIRQTPPTPEDGRSEASITALEQERQREESHLDES